jgi:hypothetical protein
MDGAPLAGVRLSSDTFEIKPGQTKTIRATADSVTGLNRAIYGRISVRSTNAAAGTEELPALPLILRHGPEPQPDLHVAELQSVEVDGRTSFQLAVLNRGRGYVPVSAKLQVADGKGRAMELADGYGRWLAPGETRLLKFVPEHRLLAGEYQLSLALQIANQAPLSKTLTVKITPQEAAPTVTAKPRKETLNAG